jgi:HTH-type transcriptional regulator/antitoxin HigA
VSEFPPRPIHTEAEYERVLSHVEAMMARTTRSVAERDYLDLLSDLIVSWEDDHYELPEASASEIIRFLLDQRGERQRSLVPIFGTESIVSEVLAGKRELQRKHIEGLAKHFHVSPSAFFQRQ